MISFRTGEGIYIDSAPAVKAFEKVKASQMSGWLEVPTPETNVEKIKIFAQKINESSDFLVCVGIGGSYLGHRAMIEALGEHSRTKVLYAGNSLSSFELKKILDEISGHDFSINVISKSGTTTEPAIAFRILKQKLIEKYGEKEAARRIYATTDARQGALHDEAEKNGYGTLIVPETVGGRYSVLTPVGLLPMAVAGIDIDAVLEGAKEATANLEAAYSYALLRALCHERNYDTEILVTFEPRMRYFTEWWKQLFGESEGKNHQGIFPAAAVYTTDLHSLGQYVQEGRRNIFETCLKFKEIDKEVTIEETADDADGLNYLAGKNLAQINETALEATIDAHRAGGILVFEIEVADGITAKTMGELVMFFEIACAISATLQGVNPFDQPGVEAYKKNMFRMLGKPGF